MVKEDKREKEIERKKEEQEREELRSCIKVLYWFFKQFLTFSTHWVSILVHFITIQEQWCGGKEARGQRAE